jgi:predicted nucleic acid-binding protein
MLIDTSGWLCLFHKREDQHSEAVKIYNKATSYLTTNYILAEFIPLAQARGFSREKSLAFARRVLDL